ncbi:hypothetical protein F5888DRAFT_255468 [Russula emetica]|nr:hypothetical protein F5888DRAFT_255468 [Russula emetica]
MTVWNVGRWRDLEELAGCAARLRLTPCNPALRPHNGFCDRPSPDPSRAHGEVTEKHQTRRGARVRHSSSLIPSPSPRIISIMEVFIAVRVIYMMERFVGRPFHQGKLSCPISVTAVLWIAFTSIAFCLPELNPVSRKTHNYTPVAVAGIVLTYAVGFLGHKRPQVVCKTYKADCRCALTL